MTNNKMKFEERIDAKNILVIGDIMLDRYYYGLIKRISPEAPVPIFNKKREKQVLGGAANVAANLIVAGQNVSILAAVGNDVDGNNMLELLDKLDINHDMVIKTDRKTTVKTRFIANNNQQVIRLDEEDTSHLSAEEYQRVLDIFLRKVSTFDIIIISDYMKGLLEKGFTQNLISIANSNNVRVLVDVKEKDFSKYDNSYIIKPNLNELNYLTDMPVESDEDIELAAKYLKTTSNATYVLATCGARGMALVNDTDCYFIDSVGKEVYDVTGAGDTTISYLATCLANGINIKESVEISNYAAGIQVSKLGTSVVSLYEVSEFLDNDRLFSKILSEDEIDHFRDEYKNKKIVVTNGCFDILHVGHIRYLQATSKLGDILIVGLNSDQSVKRLKGESRPINVERDRAELIAALEFVDYVAIFEEDTPYNLIKKIQPDVLVKGGDYKVENIVGNNIVYARGGEVITLPFVEGKSTTSIINRINRK